MIHLLIFKLCFSLISGYGLPAPPGAWFSFATITPEQEYINKDLHSSAKAKGTPPFFSVHSDYTPGGARSHFRAMSEAWSCRSQTSQERALFFKLRSEVIAAEDSAIGQAGFEPGDGDMQAGKGGHWDWDGEGYEGPRYAIFSIWRPWEVGCQRDPLAFDGYSRI
ncbi:hypothetical protein WAI453_011420 [Rhynchosporium graminicola]